MRKIISLLVPGLLLGALAAPADAAIYSTSFSGTVTQQTGTALSVGGAISGAFVYSSDQGRFLSFTVDGASATPPYASVVSTTPGANPFTALFEAQNSAVQQGGTNQTFSLDLEALTSFKNATALAILADPTLKSQLDPSLSQFSYFIGNADGTGIRSVTAALTVSSLNTAVPEPVSLALLAAPVFGVVLRRRG
jgi:hypothetical protein